MKQVRWPGINHQTIGALFLDEITPVVELTEYIAVIIRCAPAYIRDHSHSRHLPL